MTHAIELAECAASDDEVEDWSGRRIRLIEPGKRAPGAGGGVVLLRGMGADE